MDVIVMVSQNQEEGWPLCCEADGPPKRRIISLFSGVLGLELGLSEPEPHEVSTYGCDSLQTNFEINFFNHLNVFEALRRHRLCADLRKFSLIAYQLFILHLVTTCLEVEWSSFCQEVIRSRMADGFVAQAPIFSDIKSFTPSGSLLDCDGYLLGFPCQAGCFFIEASCACSDPVCTLANADQGISASGHGLGLADGRSCLVKEIFRLLDCTPSACPGTV